MLYSELHSFMKRRRAASNCRSVVWVVKSHKKLYLWWIYKDSVGWGKQVCQDKTRLYRFVHSEYLHNHKTISRGRSNGFIVIPRNSVWDLAMPVTETCFCPGVKIPSHPTPMLFSLAKPFHSLTASGSDHINAGFRQQTTTQVWELDLGYCFIDWLTQLSALPYSELTSQVRESGTALNRR